MDLLRTYYASITILCTYYAPITHLLRTYHPITRLLRAYYAPISLLRTCYAPVTEVTRVLRRYFFRYADTLRRSVMTRNFDTETRNEA